MLLKENVILLNAQLLRDKLINNNGDSAGVIYFITYICFLFTCLCISGNYPDTEFCDSL